MLFRRRSRKPTPSVADTGIEAIDPDLLTGGALVDVVMAWAEWCHRRVDSLHVLEGERGRRRQSIDCTPPPDPRLLVDRAARTDTAISPEHGPMILPLALIKKTPLRHFDMRDGHGNPMPLLRSDEITDLQLSMLAYMFGIDGVELVPKWRDILCDLLGSGESDSASDNVTALFDTGKWKGERVWWTSPRPSDVTSGMVRNFAESFLLLSAVDSQHAGTRQILKYSYHWNVDAPKWDRLSSPFIAVGGERRISIDLEQAAAARSYHFEVPTPAELECAALVLPPSDTHPVVYGQEIDESGSPIAHAHGSYASTPTGKANLFLRLPRRGLWLATTVATLFTAAVVGGVLYLPNAKDVWMGAQEAAAALLIAAPAVYFGLLLATGRETRLATGPLGFLRVLLFLCTISLFIVATSIVGELNQPWFDTVLITVFVWHAVAAAFLIIGRITFSTLQKNRRGNRKV